MFLSVRTSDAAAGKIKPAHNTSEIPALSQAGLTKLMLVFLRVLQSDYPD